MCATSSFLNQKKKKKEEGFQVLKLYKVFPYF